MSIVSVNELGRDRTATFGEQGRRQYTRSIIVVTDDEQDGPLTVATATDPVTGETIPTPGQIYVAGNDTDTTVRVVNVTPRQLDDEHGKVWSVLVQYDSEFSDVPDNPLSRPTEISSGFAQFQRPAFFDINGQAITNSARQYFDPAVMVDDSRPVITMVRNFSSFNLAMALDYQDAVNDGPWWLFPTRAVKVANIGAQTMSEAGISFIKATFEFHIRRDLWIPLKILDAGRKDINGKEQLSNGQIVTEPWPLNTSGAFLSVGFALNTINFKQFTVYRERNFSLLGVP